METLKKIFIRETKRETVAMFLTLAYLMFQCYRTFLHPLPALLIRPIHVASVALLCTLFVPFKTKDKPAWVKTAVKVTQPQVPPFLREV